MDGCKAFVMLNDPDGRVNDIPWHPAGIAKTKLSFPIPHP
jgi:hypothetical protein